MLTAEGIAGEPSRRSSSPHGGEPALRTRDRGVPARLRRLVARCRPSSSRRCRATRSAPASSSRSPATCGCVADDVAFAMRETSLGLVPDLGGTAPLVRLSATPGRWRSARPGGRSRAARRVRLGLAAGRRTAGGARRHGRATWSSASSQAPAAAVRELKPLLRGAVDATPADQLRPSARPRRRLLRRPWLGRHAGSNTRAARRCQTRRRSMRQDPRRPCGGQAERRPHVDERLADDAVADARLVGGAAQAGARARRRRVVGFARPYRRQIIAFLVLVVVDAVLVVAPPLLLKAIVDDGVTPKDAERRRAARRSSWRSLAVARRGADAGRSGGTPPGSARA